MLKALTEHIKEFGHDLCFRGSGFSYKVIPQVAITNKLNQIKVTKNSLDRNSIAYQSGLSTGIINLDSMTIISNINRNELTLTD